VREQNPLLDPPPKEVPLPHAPLVRVIAQVRFPLITSIEKTEFVSGFQEKIRGAYPVLRREETRGAVIGQAGILPAQSQVVYRFSNEDDAWRVSLAPEFVAIETTSYSSRSDFLARLRVVLEALAGHISPKTVDRLGVRYIDRVVAADAADIGKLVRPEVLGVVGTLLGRHAQHSLCESLLAMPDGSAHILARWGRIPANGSVDPDAIEPMSEPSWILDLDMFHVGSREFAVTSLVEQAQAYAERIYAVFRWTVTKEFLRRFGGKV
jgi:uncharacterized protein (TIGR04255 family)